MKRGSPTDQHQGSHPTRRQTSGEIDGGDAPKDLLIAYMADFDGYQCLVFLHEAGNFSVVLVRPTADAALKAVRFEAAFDAACGAIPESEASEARRHPHSRSRPADTLYRATLTAAVRSVNATEPLGSA